MAEQTLLVERADDRILVRLHRPEARNAINQQMVDELHAVCAELETVPRTLILAGGEGVFASGADIGELRQRRAADARRGINSRLFARIASLPMPVVAAIDGWALGGGAELAYAADVRIATPALKIGNPEISLGIIAAAGACWRLPALVGEPLAKEILLTGRVLNAEEALAAGLVTAIHPSERIVTEAQLIADRIAAADSLAVRRTKQVLAAPRDAHPGIDDEVQAELFESPEKDRRMAAFLERKKHR